MLPFLMRMQVLLLYAAVFLHKKSIAESGKEVKWKGSKAVSGEKVKRFLIPEASKWKAGNGRYDIQLNYKQRETPAWAERGTCRIREIGTENGEHSMKQVSIILPAYNRAHCIGRAIGSILAQTYPHWELLVIDDGSTDDTEAVAAAAAASDGRVHYYRQPQNRGAAAARNEGIRRARHAYIAFQDSDDFWKADKLEKQMRLWEERPEAGMVYCAYEGTRQDGTAVRVPDGTIEAAYLQGSLYQQLLQRNFIGAPTVVMRRECIESCGMFEEGLSCLEDWELFLRIAKRYEIGYVNEALVTADIHEGGVSSGVGGYFQARCMMLAEHREALMEYGIFERTAEQVLVMAQEAGVLQPVAQMLQRLLTGAV